MDEITGVFRDIAGSLGALWIAGLVLSYRLITPAQTFLSERSAAWVADQLVHGRARTMGRRFSVGFKRYVDRVFSGRQVRWGRSRIWLLRFRDCALVSFFTYMAIFWLAVFLAGHETLRAGFEADFLGAIQSHPLAAIEEVQRMLNDPGSLAIILYGSLFVNALAFGLLNIFTDYLSFIETRNVLARLGRGGWSGAALILLDFVLTGMIAALMFVVVLYGGSLLGGEMLNTGLSAGGALLNAGAMVVLMLTNTYSYLTGGGAGLGQIEIAGQAMTLSTFATSIWIWVFATGTVMLRLAVLLSPLIRLIVFMVDAEKHPFRAVWLMFCVGWTAIVSALAIAG